MTQVLAAFDGDEVAHQTIAQLHSGRWELLASAWSPARASSADTGAGVGFHQEIGALELISSEEWLHAWF